MLKNLWYRIQQPAGITTWRYLTQRSNPVVRQHWKALWYPTVKQSKIFSWGLVIVQQLAWWIFFGWRAFFQVWSRLDKWQHLEGLPSKRQQLINMWSAIFLYSIPPSCYYVYQLYRYPKYEWLAFIYAHEVPKWQQSLSGKVRKEHQRYISSKGYFAEKSLANHIPAIPTLQFVQKGKELQAKDIFQQRSLFFKPDQANQSKGCFSLSYQKGSNNYFLIQEKFKNGIEEAAEILQALNTHFQQQHYLIQPLLENHQEMTELCGTERLTTLRIITATDKEEIRLVSAILEVPKKNKRRYYPLVSIDTESGSIINELLGQHLQKKHLEETEWLQQVQSKSIPNWQGIQQVVKKAHLLCKDYKTIGWDVSVTPVGVKLLEGNAGWGIRAHQMTTTTRKQMRF